MSMKEDAFVINCQLHEIQKTIRGLQTIKSKAVESTTSEHVQSSEPLSLQAVVNHALWPQQQNASTLESINASIEYKQWYKMALDAICIKYSPPQVAASTALAVDNGVLIERKAAGFTLKISQDPANNEEIYVVIKLQNQNLASKSRHTC